MTFSHLADNQKINFKLFNALGCSLKALTCIKSNPPTLARLMKISRTCGQKNAIRCRVMIHLIQRNTLNNCLVKQLQVNDDFFYLFELRHNCHLKAVLLVVK